MWWFQNLTCDQGDPHTVWGQSRPKSWSWSLSWSWFEDPGAILVRPPGPGVRHAAGRRADWKDATGLSWGGVRWPRSGYSWFQRGQRCEFTAFSGFNTFRSELEFLLYTLYISSPAAGGLKRLEGQPTWHHADDIMETRQGPQEVQVHQGSPEQVTCLHPVETDTPGHPQTDNKKPKQTPIPTIQLSQQTNYKIQTVDEKLRNWNIL